MCRRCSLSFVPIAGKLKDSEAAGLGAGADGD